MKIEIVQYENGRWNKELPILEEPVLGFVFGAPEFRSNQRPFDDLESAYHDVKLVGCSTAGEIRGSEISDGTVVAGLLSFESSSFDVCSLAIEDFSTDRELGIELGKQLCADDLRGVYVLSDGLDVNGTELAEGLNAQLPTGVVASGGLGGDGEAFDHTWVLVDGKPRGGHVTAVGFYGDRVVLSFGSEGGWQPFGPERLVTKSDGNVLYALDGLPALELYKKYLGDRASGLPATGLLFPLQITVDGRPLVRTILAVDEDRQSMTFAGDIPEGSSAQLMRSTHDSLIDGAEAAAKQSVVGVDEAEFCIAVSCVGRRLVLGEGCEDEVEATQEGIGEAAKQIGFYSYGELAPTGDQPCGLHNQTMTITAIRERSEREVLHGK